MKKILTNTLKKYRLDKRLPPYAYSASVWRYERPVWDRDRCFKCGICYLSCPDAAIREIDEGYYDIDADACKGCGICAEKCLNEAITMTREERDIFPTSRFIKKEMRR